MSAMDTLIVFSDVRLVTFDGRKGRDQDVTLHFGSGQIAIVPKKGGTVLAALPYTTVARATYSHGKDPKWSSTLPGLPYDPDIPGLPFTRGGRHWLVLQSTSSYLALVLSNGNALDVLEAFEVRTHLRVDKQ